MLAAISRALEERDQTQGHGARVAALAEPLAEALRGRAIPIEARLLAVADAFDAMTSPRPYRQALSAEHALADVRRCAGSQFDPRVAALFLEVWSTQPDVWPAAVAS